MVRTRPEIWSFMHEELKLFGFNSAFPGYAAGLTEREEKLQ